MHLDVWQQKSDRICNHLQSWEIFAQAQVVLAYFSFRQEADLSPLFSTPHRWGFPICQENLLAWHQWSPSNLLPLQVGAFGILEPHPDSPNVCPQDVDLILVPAVACDAQGYRLGYGAGFYDRMLSQPEWSNALTIGIVFEFAYLPTLPHDPWDRPLHGVCTETGLYLTATSTR
jgi:5-formyltetrahydrofolate cyclo-ligase